MLCFSLICLLSYLSLFDENWSFIKALNYFNQTFPSFTSLSIRSSQIIRDLIVHVHVTIFEPHIGLKKSWPDRITLDEWLESTGPVIQIKYNFNSRPLQSAVRSNYMRLNLISPSSRKEREPGKYQLQIWRERNNPLPNQDINYI